MPHVVLGALWAAFVGYTLATQDIDIDVGDAAHHHEGLLLTPPQGGLLRWTRSVRRGGESCVELLYDVPSGTDIDAILGAWEQGFQDPWVVERTSGRLEARLGPSTISVSHGTARPP